MHRRRPRPWTSDPAWLGFVTFTSTLVIQMFHESEHVMQMVEKYLWHWRTFPGILGYWFNFEWIHFLFNTALWIALLATWITYRKNPGMWRESGAAAFALNFVIPFQAWHVVEHVIRIYQYYAYGWPQPPGLLGQVFSVLELHFWIGMVVSTAMITAYVGFRPWTGMRLRQPLAQAYPA